MTQHLSMISLVIDDYDRAIDHYVNTFGFELVEDTELEPSGKRWVVVRPAGSTAAKILLAKAKNDREKAAIGNQSGGRVWLFLDTDDFWPDYERYLAQGVEIARAPSEESYGMVCVLKDGYGNLWDLVQRH
ncbi:MAG: VOC family protein [Gammaproteobacteria bacterium]|nr:VOC family protein [Gammaproteobacteria bacterium]